MTGVKRFEIAASDPVSSKKFYEEVFGWKIAKWDEPDSQGNDYYEIEIDGSEAGIGGGIMKATEQVGGKLGFVNGIQVKDIDAAIEKLVKSGGKLLGKKTVMPNSLGSFAYAEDPDGNVFSLLQFETEM